MNTIKVHGELPTSNDPHLQSSVGPKKETWENRGPEMYGRHFLYGLVLIVAESSHGHFRIHGKNVNGFVKVMKTNVEVIKDDSKGTSRKTPSPKWPPEATKEIKSLLRKKGITPKNTNPIKLDEIVQQLNQVII